MKILVAEDNEFQSKLIRELLIAEGHAVVIAADGQDAMLKLGRESFDLLLADTNMPVMGGFDLVNTLRKFKNPIPFLMYSSIIVDEDYINLALRSGVDKYISKISVQGIVNEVLNFIKRVQ